MVDIRAKYGMKGTKKADFLHSSGYAKEQSGDNIGSASTATFATRNAIEEQRKFVQEYRNAKILQGIRGYEKAKSYVPRVEKTAGVARGRGSLQGSSDLSSTPSTGSAMAARANAPTGPIRPTGPTITSPPARRLPGIKF